MMDLLWKHDAIWWYNSSLSKKKNSFQLWRETLFDLEKRGKKNLFLNVNVLVLCTDTAQDYL